MTKNIILTVILIFGTCLHGFAGQETGGGDINSLIFVKIGRLLAYEMQYNKNCTLKNKTSLQEFKKKLDNLKIEMGGLEKQGHDNQVYVNIFKWRIYSAQLKIEKVFSTYTGLTPKRDELSSCIQKTNWEKIGEAGLDNQLNENMNVKNDAVEISKKLVTFLKTSNFAIKHPQINIQELSQIINKAPKDISTSTNAIKFEGGALKDGVNWRTLQSKGITVNKSTWRILSIGQKMELMLHEYLGLAGVNDRRYQLSSQLFFDLSVADYAS